MSSRLYTRYIWPIYVLVGLTTISGFILTHIASSASATDATVVPASVTLTASCTLSSGGGNYAESMTMGTSTVIGNTITASCNDSAGYAIYAIGYTGDSYTGTNTDLIHSSNTSYNIKTDGSSATGSSWKMKLTAGANATVVNDYTNFHNIPATYDKVASYTSATSSGTITPTYQINITATQPEGTYVGQVKYTLVNPNNAVAPETKVYIQDLTLEQCQKNVGLNGNAANIGDTITVYDRRANSGNNNYASGDEGDYTVRYINGTCWMTQNLRIQGTISATDSNFTGSDFNVSEYDLKTNGVSECFKSNGYNNPCSRVPDSTDMSTIGSGVTAKEVGAWYNYYAASAGTISSGSNSTVASSDICPYGWHLPTGAAHNTSSELYKLFQSTSMYPINPNNYLTAFGAVKGGYYYGATLTDVTGNYWWSATAVDTTSRYYLNYNSRDVTFFSGTNYRYDGRSVRCVRTI